MVFTGRLSDLEGLIYLHPGIAIIRPVARVREHIYIRIQG